MTAGVASGLRPPMGFASALGSDRSDGSHGFFGQMWGMLAIFGYLRGYIICRSQS